MTRNLSHSSTHLLSEAAHWYNERLSGDMTANDEAVFFDWLGRSPAHAKAYQTVDRVWIAAEAPPIQELREEPKIRLAKRAMWLIGTALAASILLALAPNPDNWHFLDRSDEIKTVQNFETTTGQRSVITLPDGTRVTMDSETVLKFSDLRDERSVQLIKGRAYFNVAKNTQRPFIVHAGGKSVKAIGTIFEVSITGDIVAVVLAEGKVRVEDVKRRGSAELTPGRQLVMRSDKLWTLENVDLKKETSWTEGRLIFMSDPLSQAVEEVNRYSNRKIIFEEGATPPTAIVGVFSAGDVDGFVKALELNGIAHLISSSQNEVTMRAGVPD